MGVVANITASRFPRQSDHLGKRTRVCFHYDTSVLIGGVVLRDDLEKPFITIIRLDTGIHVLGTECQYTPPV